ncbi:PTS sugar transporter subunit IIB [Bacillus fonticola]|uniref:PTS sugar transporter subunit IIB n=1 Tax=Bacillus fonticola TaxID=2728853 RepID=UPI0014736D0D|nr:PTS sugar transporter subunit IIB [Bacillus fonticola]
MKKILFVCAGGMSSAIVVKALKIEASKQGLEVDVNAVGTSDVESEIGKGWDVVMVAPQVRHRFDAVKKVADQAGVPCEPIPPQAYSPLGGPKLLQKLNEMTS